MKTLKIIRELLDEIPIVIEISKDLPFPYNIVIEQKTKEFNAYLIEINSLETEKYNSELQNYAIDLLTELESQQFTETNPNP